MSFITAGWMSSYCSGFRLVWADVKILFGLVWYTNTSFVPLGCEFNMGSGLGGGAGPYVWFTWYTACLERIEGLVVILMFLINFLGTFIDWNLLIIFKLIDIYRMFWIKI